MASLRFYYSAMNAGKSTALLQAAYNYRERGMVVDLFKPTIDTRESTTEIVSRIGISATATLLGETDSFFIHYREKPEIHCILVDEAQFLQPSQIYELRTIVDMWQIPVLCYGLRTDFKRELFPGSQVLMAVSDRLTEIKGLCHCGRAAKFVLRMDEHGDVVRAGGQIQVGGNDQYSSVCSLHWSEGQPKR